MCIRDSHKFDNNGEHFFSFKGRRNLAVSYTHLARTMGIPAVIGLGELLQPQLEGMDCIADGFTGEVLLSPTAETKAAYLEKQQKELEHRHGLERCV